MQSTGLVRHVFRLLETALKNNRGVPWVLLENVHCVAFQNHLWLMQNEALSICGQPAVTPITAEQECGTLGMTLRDCLHTEIGGYRRRTAVLKVQVEGLLDRCDGQAPVIQYVAQQFERLGYSSWAQRIINTAGLSQQRAFFYHADLIVRAADRVISLNWSVAFNGSISARVQLFQGTSPTLR